MGPIDISRRPSPWHEVAHSLSTTSLPRQGTGTATPPISKEASTTGEQESDAVDVGDVLGRKGGNIDIACDTTSYPEPSSNTTPSWSYSSSSSLTCHTPSPPPSPSTSQALKDWEARLSHPQPTVTRHRLDSSQLHRHGQHKLAAESDKFGFIEYKLKLTDPTNERFERLVTQLMWRLKQGKNEAIYELGLADDGTVVGLSRAEMDASLRTLELMASEVGATVIVLREIVLHTPRSRNSNLLLSRQSVSTTSRRRLRKLQPHSSTLSSSSDHDQDQDHAHDVTNTSADSRIVKTKHGECDLSLERQQKLSKNKARRRHKKKSVSADGPVIYGGTIPKKMIFDQHDLLADSDDSLSDDRRSSEILAKQDRRRKQANGGDDSPFSFDFEEEDKTLVEGEYPNPQGTKQNVEHETGVTIATGIKGLMDKNKKEEKKRRKSVARQEQRRLDLLRGDGTNPFWAEFDSAPAPGAYVEPYTFVGRKHGSSGLVDSGRRKGGDWTANVSSTPLNGQAQNHTILSVLPPKTPLSASVNSPHQPTRPSSLRLATPTDLPEDWFVDDLLHIPLDSLSLSFADVQSIPANEADVTSGAVIPAATPKLDDPDKTLSAGGTLSTKLSDSQEEANWVDENAEGEREWDELICVEALVVRKSQYDGTGANVDPGEDGIISHGSDVGEEEWSYGGEEDVWGFGGDDD
ncbi:hypothetical protein IAT40_003082 [Kwoniella sp. CBS 6097]